MDALCFQTNFTDTLSSVHTVAIHDKPQFQLRIDVTSPHETVKFTSLLVDLLLVMSDHGADHSGTNNALLFPPRDRAAGPRQSR